MNENQETPIQLPPPNKKSSPITRRQFLIRGAATLAAIAAGTSLIRDPVIDVLKQNKKKEIEAKYGIAIRTEKEMIDDPAIDIRKDPFWEEPEHPILTAISEESLDLLNKSLSFLPKHFYEPNNGKKLTITFTNDTSSSHRTLPSEDPILATQFSTSNRLHTEEITLGKTFDTQKHKDAFLALTHELTHRITPGTDGKVTPSVWFEEVDTIFGMPFKDIESRIRPQINTVMDPIKQKTQGALLNLPESEEFNLLNPQEQELAIFFTRFYYGINNTNFGAGELIGIMGEQYIQGKDYFKKMYDKFLPPETTEKLYEFCKDKIYRNIEYIKLPDIR